KVNRDVRAGGSEQFHDLLLREPHRLPFEPHLYVGRTIIAAVEQHPPALEFVAATPRLGIDHQLASYDARRSGRLFSRSEADRILTSRSPVPKWPIPRMSRVKPASNETVSGSTLRKAMISFDCACTSRHA